jgi:tRNA (cmo5U34)-methyltransferase
MTENNPSPIPWKEEYSQQHIETGRYFVPDRQVQIDIICTLLPDDKQPGHVLELCCGEGLLAEAILERFPICQVTGLDGSTTMLEHAQSRLARFAERFRLGPFDLFAKDWRKPDASLQAIVSSLAIHHLDGAQKQALFRDLYAMLAPGGVLVIADIIQPASALGNLLAAEAWEASVRQQNLELDGNTAKFERLQQTEWNIFRYPDPMDKPSPIFDQLGWLEAACFKQVDVYWLKAGHAIYGGQKDV